MAELSKCRQIQPCLARLDLLEARVDVSVFLDRCRTIAERISGRKRRVGDVVKGHSFLRASHGPRTAINLDKAAARLHGISSLATTLKYFPQYLLKVHAKVIYMRFAFISKDPDMMVHSPAVEN